MKYKEELILYFLFWLLYIPVSLFMMQFKPVNYIVVLLIGLGIILGYLVYKDIKEDSTIVESVLQEPIEQRQSLSADITGFENVFKPNFGKIEYDLN